MFHSKLKNNLTISDFYLFLKKGTLFEISFKRVKRYKEEKVHYSSLACVTTLTF